jgi:hypothetical protein
MNGILASTPKDTGSGLFLRDSLGINGNAVEVSNSVFGSGGIIGDWSQFMMLIWGGIDLVVDEISL